MDFMKLLGQQIADIRKYRNISQEELAERAGISGPFLSNLERGERTPSLDTIKQIADSLNVTVSELFLFEPQANHEPYKPLVTPLAEYIRRKRLNHNQVHELINVAKALFGE